MKIKGKVEGKFVKENRSSVKLNDGEFYNNFDPKFFDKVEEGSFVEIEYKTAKSKDGKREFRNATEIKKVTEEEKKEIQEKISDVQGNINKLAEAKRDSIEGQTAQKNATEIVKTILTVAIQEKAELKDLLTDKNIQTIIDAINKIQEGILKINLEIDKNDK